jgi:hypothetical protein
MTAWKAHERKVAKLTGGTRISRSDDWGREDLDVEHPYLAIDCKYRKSLAVWSWFKKLEVDTLKKMERDIRMGKDPHKKIPTLILKEKGKKGELAVITIEDLLMLLEKYAP